MKAAVLVGDSKGPNLVSLSYYHSKPVYFVFKQDVSEDLLSTKDTKTMARRFGKEDECSFFRFNIVDEYSYGVGSVRQADHLCLQ